MSGFAIVCRVGCVVLCCFGVFCVLCVVLSAWVCLLGLILLYFSFLFTFVFVFFFVLFCLFCFVWLLGLPCVVGVLCVYLGFALCAVLGCGSWFGCLAVCWWVVCALALGVVLGKCILVFLVSGCCGIYFYFYRLCVDALDLFTLRGR